MYWSIHPSKRDRAKLYKVSSKPVDQRHTITYVVTGALRTMVVWFNYRICSKTGIFQEHKWGLTCVQDHADLIQLSHNSNRDLQGNFIETVQWPFPHLYSYLDSHLRYPRAPFPPPLCIPGPVPTSNSHLQFPPPFPPPIPTSVPTYNMLRVAPDSDFLGWDIDFKVDLDTNLDADSRLI